VAYRLLTHDRLQVVPPATPTPVESADPSAGEPKPAPTGTEGTTPQETPPPSTPAGVVDDSATGPPAVTASTEPLSAHPPVGIEVRLDAAEDLLHVRVTGIISGSIIVITFNGQECDTEKAGPGNVLEVEISACVRDVDSTTHGVVAVHYAGAISEEPVLPSILSDLLAGVAPPVVRSAAGNTQS
jgi:hypothetical protein